jgi:hypothetical protein
MHPPILPPGADPPGPTKQKTRGITPGPLTPPAGHYSAATFNTTTDSPTAGHYSAGSTVPTRPRKDSR